ncbi:hypothetical protein ACHAWO_008107 [Cyclotella atomus]|uniref:Uncharacterized protein n=1 Tax=Cyclotella atomus TaxID=382360 RepID=A0ABD3NUY5_9STRA
MFFRALLTGAMRRSNKPSGYSAASPPGHHHRPSSHLDISSSHDDEAGDKLHKSKRRPHSKAKILVTALCGLVALGTLVYVAKLVGGSHLSSLLQFKTSHMSAIHNMHHKTKHRHHDKPDISSVDTSNAAANILLPPDSIYRSSVTDIHGISQDLIQYAGSISLVVNSRGFVVLAFPSNDYHQEKETDSEILEGKPEKSRSGNFHKYLVQWEGRAVKGFGHRVGALEMEEDIVELLEENEEKENHVIASDGVRHLDVTYYHGTRRI